MDIYHVIDKVKKLRSLTFSNNANEAANAANAANKLIDEYRLSEIDIAVEGSGSDPIVEDDSYIYETGRITQWKSDLIRVLASHYGVVDYINSYYPEGRKVSKFKLVGRSSDIQIVRYMFAWLNTECQRLATAQVKGQGHVVVASYCRGFVAGIAIQLKASRQEVQKTATSSAIVKLDARLQESENFLYSKHTNIKTVHTKSHSQISPQAFLAGQQQGKNIHLGAALGGSKTKMLGA